MKIGLLAKMQEQNYTSAFHIQWHMMNIEGKFVDCSDTF